MSDVHDAKTAATQELAILKKQLRKARLQQWLSQRKSLFFAGSHRSAKARKAIPIASLLRTSESMILAVSGIGGSALGFVIGHALMGWQGTLVAVPLFGAIVFFAVARFAFNGSLYDEPTLLQKSEEESASSERWQATAEGVAELITRATERVAQLRTETAVIVAAKPVGKKRLPGSAGGQVTNVNPTAVRIEPELIIDSWESLPPTDKQIEFARVLGIRTTGRECRGDLATLIDIELAKRRETRVSSTRERYRGMQIAPNPGIAVLFNLFWPGVGQVYQGRAVAGLFLMFATPVGYFCLILPGMFLHLIAIADAALYRPRTN